MEKQSSKSFTITEPDILITRLALTQPTLPSCHIKQLHLFFLVSYFEEPRICTSRGNGLREFQNWYLKFLLPLSHGVPLSWRAYLTACLFHGVPLSWRSYLMACLSHGVPLYGVPILWRASLMACLSMACLSHGV